MAADVPILAAVHLAAVTVAYTGLFPPDARVPTIESLEQEWAAEIEDQATSVLIAHLGTEGVGTVAVRPDPDRSDCGQLRRLHVRPDWWDRTIGSQLYDAALVWLKTSGFSRASLWVLEGNIRARRMYERRGWQLAPGRLRPWPGLELAEVRYERDLVMGGRP